MKHSLTAERGRVSQPIARSDSAAHATELLLLLVIMIWGTNYAIIKASLRQFSPLAFNAVRFVLSSALLLLLARRRRLDLRVPRQQAAQIAGLSLLCITLYQIFFIEGIARTTSANSAMILAASPALVVVASHVTGGERMRLPAMLGVGLAFLGLVSVIGGGEQGLEFSNSNLRGDLLTLAAVLCWSAYTVLAQPTFQRFSPLKLTVLSHLYGTAPMLLWSGPALCRQDWLAIDGLGWLGVCYSGIFSIALSYVIWNHSIARLGASQTAIYSNFVPVVAVLTGVLFLGERMTLSQAFGALAVIAGIMLARRP
ncbi:MAG: DMT family transporter [candidate division KSB1 bacterium]|nr:DMT family transporter [candidate division KSB1 bacterium]MDZ7274833.1 DMT family transporter [candidate division KSB1 bacterium]MDZ7288200.1 DMT family transporter [candidate division KSB1 bacterium]MDZ7300419.1 DMT family transporter [candidate division KSB1 bacterium]MDZ7308126.1 DMT family transporter [candidate division KSB1 bacterium]